MFNFFSHFRIIKCPRARHTPKVKVALLSLRCNEIADNSAHLLLQRRINTPLSCQGNTYIDMDIARFHEAAHLPTINLGVGIKILLAHCGLPEWRGDYVRYLSLSNHSIAIATRPDRLLINLFLTDTGTVNIVFVG